MYIGLQPGVGAGAGLAGHFTAPDAEPGAAESPPAAANARSPEPQPNELPTLPRRRYVCRICISEE